MNLDTKVVFRRIYLSHDWQTVRLKLGSIVLSEWIVSAGIHMDIIKLVRDLSARPIGKLHKQTLQQGKLPHAWKRQRWWLSTKLAHVRKWPAAGHWTWSASFAKRWSASSGNTCRHLAQHSMLPPGQHKSYPTKNCLLNKLALAMD